MFIAALCLFCNLFFVFQCFCWMFLFLLKEKKNYCFDFSNALKSRCNCSMISNWHFILASNKKFLFCYVFVFFFFSSTTVAFHSFVKFFFFCYSVPCYLLLTVTILISIDLHLKSGSTTINPQLHCHRIRMLI